MLATVQMDILHREVYTCHPIVALALDYTLGPRDIDGMLWAWEYESLVQ